jgi:dephospho-CoA kinase
MISFYIYILKKKVMRIVAIVGMPGSGKTEASDFFAKKGYQFIRLGQLTLDEVKKRGLEPTEANERPIREEFRKKHGMDAFAKLNFPKIDTLMKKGNVVIDGLYSWEEYLAFKEKYPGIVVIAINASPKTRYERLEKQKYDREKDTNMKRRHYTKEEAASRDCAQLENMHTGGPIAMADFTVVNELTLRELNQCLEEIVKAMK